jgi:hypothetical protein
MDKMTMTVKTILKATFTDAQRQSWLGADWGCFTRTANEKVATVIIKMLEDGIETTLIEDGYRIVDELESASGVGEITDSEPRMIICNVLDYVATKGEIPLLAPDWHDHEEGDN